MKSPKGAASGAALVAGTEIVRLLGPPALLPSEDEGAYNALVERVRSAVGPQDVLEEFWIRDVVDLAWETLRLRRLKAKLFETAAHEGLAQLLDNRLEFPGYTETEVRRLIRRWAQREPEAVKEFERLLEQAGLDPDAVAAATLAFRRDIFSQIDRMILQTEARRNAALREIDRHRDSLARRLRQEADAIAAATIEDAEFSEVSAEPEAAQ